MMNRRYQNIPLDKNTWAPDYFLGEGSLSSVLQIEASSTKAFDIARRINRVGHELLITLSMKEDEHTKQILATLYGRALYAFQGVVVLCSRGLRFPATTELRALLELMFKLIAISRNPALSQVFVKEHALLRSRHVKNIRRLKELRPSLVPHMSPAELSKLEQQASQEKVSSGITKKMEASDWAKHANHELLYVTLYGHLSSIIHANAADLELMMSFDSAGNLKSLTYGPDGRETDDFLVTSVDLLRLCVEACCVSFSKPVPPELKVIEEEISAFPT